MKKVEYKRNLRVCNHNLELVITETSKNCANFEIDSEMLRFKIMDDIVKQLKAEKSGGEFKASYKFESGPSVKRKTIWVKGLWRIRLDYNLFYRIYRWWYNCNIAPEKVEGLFKKAFDRDAGLCIEQFEITYNRNIFDFIGFIGNHYRYGDAFMDIISDEMETYEKKYSLPAN